MRRLLENRKRVLSLPGYTWQSASEAKTSYGASPASSFLAIE
jgi:hypothetical protein